MKEAQQGKLLRAGLDALDVRPEPARSGHRPAGELVGDRPQRHQRRARLERVRPRREPLVEDPRSPAIPEVASSAWDRSVAVRTRPSTMSPIARRSPNMPSRSRSSSRISAASGLSSGSRNRSTDRRSASRRVASSAAIWRSQATWASRAWRRSPRSGPRRARRPRELADPAIRGIASGDRLSRYERIGPAAPISSARDRTAIALIGEAAPANGR